MTMAPALSRVDTGTVHLDDRLLAGGLADVRWALLGALHAGARSLVVDLSGVRRLPDTVVAVLVSAHRICRARGGALVLRGADVPTEELLRRTGLWRVLVAEPALAVA
ncbi:STAS domain-containing protein [Geodermatophilus sp. URMC 61]|uniref:STAS domain-containing protein n=1 Tax=Geodermatophilus sp. URMC 61 TaxID=3423411 RepID=UPI00406D1D5E